MANDFERGVAAARARDSQGAEAFFRRAVAAEPGNALARAWLGQAQCANGDRFDGAAELLAAGRAMLAALPEPRAAAGLQQVIAQLQQWLALPEAAALLDALVALRPDDAAPRATRAAAYAMLNRPAEALADAYFAQARVVSTPQAEGFIASLEAAAGKADDAERRLTALLATKPPPRETFRALKEMAKLLDRRGAWAESFACLERAGDVARQVPEYASVDRTLLPRVIRDNQAHVDAALVSRWAGHDFADRPAPIFVIGFFRSGTTLTQEVLASHPSLFVSDEAGLMQAVVEELARLAPDRSTTAERLATLDADGIAALRRRYWRAAVGRYGEAAIRGPFVDKHTMNTIDVGLIAAVFPDARIVFMVRDPRDVCLSSFQQLMVPTPATVHLLEWESTAQFYAQVAAWWRHIRPALAPAVIELRYEDAVTDFAATYGRLIDFIGIAWDDAVTRFHQRAAGKFISTPSRNQVSQPLYTSSVARWWRYAEPIARIAPLLAPAIADFGYSMD